MHTRILQTVTMLAAATSAHAGGANACGAHAATVIDDDPIATHQTLHDAAMSVPASALTASKVARPTTFLSSTVAIGHLTFNFDRPPICPVNTPDAIPGPAS